MREGVQTDDDGEGVVGERQPVGVDYDVGMSEDREFGLEDIRMACLRTSGAEVQDGSAVSSRRPASSGTVREVSLASGTVERRGLPP